MPVLRVDVQFGVYVGNLAHLQEHVDALIVAVHPADVIVCANRGEDVGDVGVVGLKRTAAVDRDSNIQIAVYGVNFVTDIVGVELVRGNVAVEFLHQGAKVSGTAGEARRTQQRVLKVDSPFGSVILDVAHRALQVHHDVFIVVGLHAPLQHKTVVAQIQESRSNAIGFVGVASGGVAAAGKNNQRALGLALVAHQIGHQEGTEVGIIIGIHGKTGLDILRGHGHIVAPDIQHLAVDALKGLQLRLSQGRHSVARCRDRRFLLVGEVGRVHGQQQIAGGLRQIPGFLFKKRGIIANHFIVIDFRFQQLCIVVGV